MVISGFISSFVAECQAKALTFIPTWYKYLDSEEDATGRCNPVINFTDKPEDIAKIVLALVDILLTVGGIIAIGLIIYGGIRYIISQGEPDKVKDAQHTIMNALIGLVIALLAVSIVNFVGRQLGAASGTSSGGSTTNSSSPGTTTTNPNFDPTQTNRPGMMTPQ